MAFSSRALPRFLALYGALYAAFGVLSPYFPTLLADRGLGPEAIGVLLAAGTAVRLVAGPVAGRLADRLDAPALVLAACCGAAALASFGYLTARGLAMLLAVAVGHAAVLAPLAPLTDSLALGTAAPPRQDGARGQRLDYGWLRGTGSAAFVAGSVASGAIIGQFGIEIVVVLNAGLLGIAMLCAPRVPVTLPARAEISEAGASSARDELRSLVRLPIFRRLLVVVALVLGSHALHDGFIVLRWSAAGIGPGTAGLLWSEQVVAEVVVFLFLGRPLLARLGSRGAFFLAAAAAAVRWAVMAETAWLPAMAVVEPLHGLTFALLHLAAMRLLAEIIPAGSAGTAMALYSSAIGIAAAIATLASGGLYAQFGARAFWVMAALCLLALPLALRVHEPRAVATPP